MKNTYFDSFCNEEVMNGGRMSYVPAWIPSVEEESFNGKREITLKTKHFTKGRLFLTV